MSKWPVTPELSYLYLRYAVWRQSIEIFGKVWSHKHFNLKCKKLPKTSSEGRACTFSFCSQFENKPLKTVIVTDYNLKHILKLIGTCLDLTFDGKLADDVLYMYQIFCENILNGCKAIEQTSFLHWVLQTGIILWDKQRYTSNFCK